MKYNKLKIILAERQIQITDFSEQLKMTRQGLQRSLDSDKLPYDKVVVCCKLLGLTPNEFFGWETSSSVGGNYASNVSGGNTQNSDTAILALRDELKEKGSIIKEKDKQINRLLGIIENSKKQ